MNKLLFFAKNCIHALKEMANPDDLNKSMPYFMEVFFVLFLNILSVFIVFNAFEELGIIKKVSFSIFGMLIIQSLWFMKNALFYLNLVKKLSSEKFKIVLKKEIKCLDASCCIPGNVMYYIYLSYLSILAIIVLLFWQFWTIYYEIYNMYAVNFFLSLLAFAGFIHSDKRIYEISKLLRKDDEYKNDSFLLSINNTTRNKFMLISFKGFFASLFLLCVAGVVELFISDYYNSILYVLFSFSVILVFFLNQMTFRGILTSYK